MITLGKDVFDVPAPKGMSSFALQQAVLPVAGRIVAAIAVTLRVAPEAGGGMNSNVLGALAGMDVIKVLPAALPALGQVFSEMPEGELERLTRTLLADATCNKIRLFGGVPGTSATADLFDTIMQGRTLDTWALLWHALEVWYPDFFGRARALFASGGKPANGTEESTTSDGSGPANELSKRSAGRTARSAR